MKIEIDFQERLGKVKPMHAVNNGPRSGGSSLSKDASEYFKNANIPFVRLHDTEGAYGSNQYVDVHCIFPDFSADPENAESYNFLPTDRYLKAIKDCGAEVFYRLGESIDHYEKKLYVHPPKDYLKWAKICEHIILHYNYGWADGFHYDIQYWEIWNEPDNKRMWTGTHREFFELYRVAANYLKEKFPSLKIGGYAASGFYVNNRTNPSEWFKTLVPYMYEFFDYITAENTKAPMDFFSWHCYAETPEEVALHARYADELLKKYGLTHCESILDEYNTFDSLGVFPKLHSEYASEVAATMINAQNSPLDMLMYYDMRFNYMNGVLQLIDYTNIVSLPAYRSFEFYGRLYRLGTQVALQSEGAYALAASGEGSNAVMISTFGGGGTLKVRWRGNVYGKAVITEVIGDGTVKETERFVKEEDELLLETQKNCVYMIDFFDERIKMK